MGRFFESPYTALVATVALAAFGLIALSGRYMTAGYALLAIACAIAGFALRSLPFPVATSVMLILAGAFGLVAYYLTPSATPQNTGVLVFAPSDKHLTVPYIQFGTSQVIYGPKEMGNNSPVGTLLFPALTETQFKIELVDSKYKFSSQIRDENNNLLFEIIRNEWKIAPPPLTWDRNYTDDALEVKDPTGTVILRVRAFPDRVQLQGMWWINMGPPNGVRRLYILGDPFDGGQIQIAPAHGGMTPLPVIAPMFVYPSDSHFGEIRK